MCSPPAPSTHHTTSLPTKASTSKTARILGQRSCPLPRRVHIPESHDGDTYTLEACATIPSDHAGMVRSAAHVKSALSYLDLRIPGLPPAFGSSTSTLAPASCRVCNDLASFVTLPRGDLSARLSIESLRHLVFTFGPEFEHTMRGCPLVEAGMMTNVMAWAIAQLRGDGCCRITVEVARLGRGHPSSRRALGG